MSMRFQDFRKVSLEKALNSRVSTGATDRSSHFGKRKEGILSPEQLDLILWCLAHTPHMSQKTISIEINGKDFDSIKKGKEFFQKPLESLSISWKDEIEMPYASKVVNSYWLERGMGQEMVHVAGAIAQVGVCMIGGVSVNLSPMVPYFSKEPPMNYVKGNLPDPQRDGNDSALQCIEEWRSTTSFNSKKLGWVQIGQLLWAGYGCTPHFTVMQAYGGSFTAQGKTTPSASAIYTLSLYVVNSDGIFSYVSWDREKKVPTHSVEKVTEEDLISKIQKTLPTLPEAPTYILAGSMGRHNPYFSVMEVGYATLHVILQAQALKIRSNIFTLGYDQIETLQQLLKLKDTPIALIPLGYSSAD